MEAVPPAGLEAAEVLARLEAEVLARLQAGTVVGVWQLPLSCSMGASSMSRSVRSLAVAVPAAV